jgi:hypothetical protein
VHYGNHMSTGGAGGVRGMGSVQRLSLKQQ